MDELRSPLCLQWHQQAARRTLHRHLVVSSVFLLAVPGTLPVMVGDWLKLVYCVSLFSLSESHHCNPLCPIPPGCNRDRCTQPSSSGIQLWQLARYGMELLYLYLFLILFLLLTLLISFQYISPEYYSCDFFSWLISLRALFYYLVSFSHCQSVMLLISFFVLSLAVHSFHPCQWEMGWVTRVLKRNKAHTGTNQIKKTFRGTFILQWRIML